MSEAKVFPCGVARVIPHYTGAFSMLGSGWIIGEVLMDKNKRSMTYHRIMLALSVFDFMSSFSYFITGGSFQYNTGAGTPATCTASGFFIYLGQIAIPAYNCVLSWYYYLTITKNWGPQLIYKKFEIYCHSIIIPIAITIATVPIPLERYHEWHFYCFTNDGGCGRPDDHVDGFKVLYFIVVITAMVFNSCTMTSIYIRFKKLQSRAQRFNFESTLNILGDNSEIVSRTRRDSIRLESIRRKRSRTVLTMSVLYTVPYLLTWFIPVVILLFSRLQWTGHIRMIQSSYFFIVGNVYVFIAMPLQGFLNWIVYMIPRFMKYRNLDPSWCRLGFVLEQVFGRIQNKTNSGADNDCLLGSGLEEDPVISSVPQLSKNDDAIIAEDGTANKEELDGSRQESRSENDDFGGTKGDAARCHEHDKEEPRTPSLP